MNANPLTRQAAVAPEPATFREHLQIELLRRCRSNPRYSLRAYAAFLQVEASALSKILRGNRRVSATMFAHLADRLEFTPAQRDRYGIGKLTRARRASPSASAAPVAEYRQLTADLFQVISDWYHYAILELTRIEGFRPEPKWVARKLAITPSEVNIAVERLARLGMLRVDEEGRWHDESGAVSAIQDNLTTVAMRKLQKQILAKAMHAIDEVPIELRDQTSMTMAISASMIPEAKARIREFRRELCALLKSRKPFDQVYHLGISLYPVSTGEPNVQESEI